eukprot:TRINITY_DN2540_c0_g1_i2.p1 TRINITY_DN2540_c0_g1~~TRINITY_DN2540_c0_g1_i2.p1  ORF type:complete len:569 (+),score=62.18 TRINITY_DN2540_c0_g1_i2:52-1758(+)
MFEYMYSPPSMNLKLENATTSTDIVPTTRRTARSVTASTKSGAARGSMGPLVDSNIDRYLEVQRRGLSCAGPGSAPKRCAIIGAGVAGLTAASVLHKAGHEVFLLEQLDRVGGRVHTVRDDYQDWAEAGAMRISRSHKCVLNFVELFGLETQPFVSWSPKGWYYLFGKIISIQDYIRNPLPHHRWLVDELGWELNSEMLCENNPKTLAHMWEGLVQNILEESGYGDTFEEQQTAWEYLARKYDISLREYLSSVAGWKSGTLKLFGLIGTGINGYQSTFDLSFLENIREELSLRKCWRESTVEFVEIVGGNDQLPRALAGTLGNSKILLNSTVESIEECRDRSATNRYRINYRKEGSKVAENIDVDYVVCTVPFSSLKHIQKIPEWPEEITHAINDLHYAQGAKVLLQFSARWWNDPRGPLRFENGGALTTDLMLRNIYFPLQNTDSGRGVVLASYTWEDDAKWWVAKSEADQVQEALEQLHQFISQIPLGSGQKKIDIRDYFLGGFTWSGSYSFFKPGQLTKMQLRLLEPVEGIYFAGEHASFEHAWIEGAVQSGMRAAIQIHQATSL